MRILKEVFISSYDFIRIFEHFGLVIISMLFSLFKILFVRIPSYQNLLIKMLPICRDLQKLILFYVRILR